MYSKKEKAQPKVIVSFLFFFAKGKRIISDGFRSVSKFVSLFHRILITKNELTVLTINDSADKPGYVVE